MNDVSISKVDYVNIVDFINKIEKEYKLPELKQEGVYFWKLIRVPLMNKIVSKLNNVKNIHGIKARKDIFPYMIDLVVKGIINKPRLKRQSYEILFFENPRKVLYKGILIDPYTHFYIENAMDYYVLENTYQLKHSKSYYKPSGSTHNLELKMKVLQKLSKNYKLREDNLELLKTVQKRFEDKFKLNLDLESLVKKHIKIFKSGYTVYKNAFEKTEIKQLFIVCSYGKEHIIHAAQECNIRVIEFQHGVMGPLHLGYNFETWSDVPYFPDELMMFGKFWSDITNLPIKTKKTIYGYPYLNHQVDDLKSKNEINNTIVIISQGTVGKRLSEILLDVIKNNKQLNFVYKLHPGEFNRWREDYPALTELSTFDNVEVIEKERSLYEVFSTSKVCIGVYSTAIFEAIAFGSTPLIINLPGSEYTKELNDLYKLNYFDNSQKITEYLRDIVFKETDYKKIEYIWAKNEENISE